MKITKIILVDDSGKQHEIELPKHHNVAVSCNIREIPIFIDNCSTPIEVVRDNVFTLISSPTTVRIDKISSSIQEILNKDNGL